MRLDLFSSAGFDRGAPRSIEALWVVVNGLLLSSWLPGSTWRVHVLRAFGAKVGYGVVIKPGVRVKFPWRLKIGNHSWIGEDVWIDNLAEVSIGSNACLSQGVYLCTGSHDWNRESFDLITQPIDIAEHAWIGARALLAPGAKVGSGTIICMGSIGKGDMTAWTVYDGNPAAPKRPRPITQRSTK